MQKKTVTRIEDSRQRRSFLKGVAVGSGVAALGLSPATASAAVEEGEGAKQTGYRESAHVAEYYRTTKL